MRHQAGFNMVEVLVAVGVLAIGLLGIAALQIQGLRQNYGSYSRSQAVMLANDYVERLYANKPAAEASAYGGLDSNPTFSSFPATNNYCSAQVLAKRCGAENGDAAVAADCTPLEMAAYDRHVVACGYPVDGARRGGINDQLLGGRIQVVCLDDLDAVITVAPLCPPGARHRVTVSWRESTQGSAAGAQTELEAVQFEMTVRP